MSLVRKSAAVVPDSPLVHLPDFPRLPAEAAHLPGVAQLHADMQRWWFDAKTVHLRALPGGTSVTVVADPSQPIAVVGGIGRTGEPGQPGIEGKPGIDGLPGPPGSGTAVNYAGIGPPGAIGVPGNTYTDLSNGDYWAKATAGWKRANGPGLGELTAVEFLLVGGASTDESDHLSAAFAYLATLNGTPFRLIVRSRSGSDPIRVNKTLGLYASNVTVDFRSPVSYGTNGSIRIIGSQTELLRRAPDKAKLTVNANTGDTTLTLAGDTGSNMIASDFLAGDIIIIRGQNDINGKALTKQTCHVVSRSGNILTLAEELESDFDIVYPDSDWPADLTTGTTISLAAAAALTVTAVPGDYVLQVNDTQLTSSGITAGSIIALLTNETEYDINPHSHTSTGTPYLNTARIEHKRVVSVASVGGVGRVTVDSPVLDTYAFGSPKYGSIILLDVVRNSTIQGVRGTFAVDQDSRSVNPVQIAYGYRCRLFDCQIDGSNGQKGNGVRISNSLECVDQNCVVSYPKYNDSGSGYGHAIYYSDRCQIINGTGEGCRHNFLLQKANLTDINGCLSVNEGISGIDLHGVRSFKTHIHNCRLLGGPAYYDTTDHKSLLRIGNTSHAGGDFDTLITNCFLSGALPGNLTRSGTTVITSPTLTVSTIGLAVGMPITGTGIPDDTTISAVGTTTVTLSANATASGTVTVTIPRTYAALELFGPSSGVSMRGCRVQDCDKGVRGGYDNLTSTEPDAITAAVISGNEWVNITSLKDFKTSQTVTVEDYLKRVDSTFLTSHDLVGTSPVDNNNPSITAGEEIISATYTSKAPARLVKLTAVVPYVNTSAGNTNVVCHIFVTGLDPNNLLTPVWVGTHVIRIVTSGATNGAGLNCFGTFAGTGAAQTISVRLGVHQGTGTISGKFSGNSYPYLLIEEMP